MAETAPVLLLVGFYLPILQSHVMRNASLIKRAVTICSLFLASHVSVAETNMVVLSQSPDGVFQLRRMQADPGERGEARKTLEITGRNGKTLYQWSSPLGVTSAFWSSDSRHLAVNDAPGDRGDQLRVFALDGSNQRAIPLREPDGAKLRSEVESRHGGFFSALEKVTLRSLEWKGDRLWCQVTGTFSPKRQRGIHVPFHYLWVFKVRGEEDPVLEEEWTRTDPKERPVRDPVE